MHPTLLCALLAIPLGADAEAPGPDRGLQEAIRVVRQTGSGGRGSGPAAHAWRKVAAVSVGRLPEVLAGMDGANPVACNWLRAAVDEILERARANKEPLPARALEAFLRDTRHYPRARRLAYELVLETDRTAADRLLPGMLDDPSPELRRDAVGRLLDQADKLTAEDKKSDALPLLRRAFGSARDKAQIDRAADRLRKLGETVDVARHLGMLLDWKLIGPFANAGQKGVDTAYPPEQKIDLAASYDGLAGKVRWVDHVSKDNYGLVDLNAVLGQQTEAAGYAFTEFTSREARPVEVRIGCYNGFKLWVNGELVLVRGDAYTGMDLDHYVAGVHLRPGKNTLLLKLCQAPPQPGVPALWRFQLRVCDESGAAILSTTRPASK
jgi:hypothetical protein